MRIPLPACLTSAAAGHLTTPEARWGPEGTATWRESGPPLWERKPEDSSCRSVFQRREHEQPGWGPTVPQGKETYWCIYSEVLGSGGEGWGERVQAVRVPVPRPEDCTSSASPTLNITAQCGSRGPSVWPRAGAGDTWPWLYPHPARPRGGTQDILPSISSAMNQGVRGMRNFQVFIELERARVCVLSTLTALSSVDSREGVRPPLPSMGPQWPDVVVLVARPVPACHRPCGRCGYLSSPRRAPAPAPPPCHGLPARRALQTPSVPGPAS